MKGRIELTADSVKKAIGERKPTSMTQLSQHMGYMGSVSSSLTKKFRALVPDIDALLKVAADAAKSAKGNKANAVGPKAKKAAKVKPAKVNGKLARDSRNPFREGSAYASCFDVLAAHRDGMPKVKLVELLAAATGKDIVRAGYDCQVILSAKANENGLSNNDSPRHRSCRPGFWVKRMNGSVQLMVD